MERYESLGLVGEGSYGTVLKCRHRDTGRLVAIKKFMDSDSDKTVRKIATREIKLLRKLSHDNLVNLLEVWKRRRRWYLVFEFVDRTLLEDLEQNPSGLDLNTTRQCLYQILRAVAFCHEQNIIHRDIKPENVLVSLEGVVKLCDFGLARTMALTAEGAIYTDYVATRWYRAPELLVGDVKYGKPVDVWAVGCLFLEMLTGQPLFPGDSDLDQIYHIIKCFGNLTAHHQELFYRNPVFSGVTLPECSVRVPLQDRCPTITPTALDLAQSCLQMDPDGRAQCSHLLEHPLFTLDCFHIRFLDELNAKIQKDHRENSTLPKIIKTPRQDKEDGNDRKQKGKNKKLQGDVDEKVNQRKEKKDRKEEEKMEKTKGKQPVKLSKTIQNKSDSLVFTKQSKNVGANLTDNTTRASIGIKANPGKVAGSEVTQEPDNLTEGTQTITGPKDYNVVTAKAKQWKVVAPEPNPNNLKMTNIEDADYAGSNCSYPEKNTMDIRNKSEATQELCRSRGNLDTNEHMFSQNTTNDHQHLKSSSHTSMESAAERSDTSLELQMDQLSLPSVTKPCRLITKLEHQSILTVPRTQKVSHENKEDLALSVSTDATTRSKECGYSFTEQNNNEMKPDGSCSKSLISEPQDYFGSSSRHTKPTVTAKTQKTAFHTEARKKSDNPGRNDVTSVASIADRPRASPDYRMTRGFVLHSMDTTALNDLVLYSYPPPPPSSTPFLLPPPSTPLMPSITDISTNSPPISDHFNLGTDFYPATHYLRYVDKPRYHGGNYSHQAQHSTSTPINPSATAQVSDKKLIGEQSDHSSFGNSGGVAVSKKLDIHFPDLQSLGLSELRGSDGKNNNGITKDQRKNKNPPHNSPSEP